MRELNVQALKRSNAATISTACRDFCLLTLRRFHVETLERFFTSEKLPDKKILIPEHSCRKVQQSGKPSLAVA
jgi:hypothetical protein